MAIASCVECEEEIEISGRVRLGQKIICDNCSAQLEVASVNPLELDWATEEDTDDRQADDDFSDEDDDLTLDDDELKDEDDLDDDWK